MIRLIKNEFKKLFSKKLMYILLIIIIGAVILSNVIYSIDISNFIEERSFLESQMFSLEEEMNYDEYKLAVNKEGLIDLQTQYEQIKLQLNYEVDSWQYYFIERSDIVYPIIRAVKSAEYNKDEKALKVANEEYNRLKERLGSGDWKSFINEELEDTNKQITSMEKELRNAKDIKTMQETEKELENLKISKQTLEWRLEKDIPYGNSFLSVKIEDYRNSSQFLNGIKDNDNKSKEEQINYDESVKTANVAKYYIENNINIKNEFNAGYILANIMNEYGVFIIIFSIIVAGTIVSQESQKGTIKLLLTRPYSRNKILLSKYIVSIISIFLFIITFMIVQYIVGGIVDGFSIFKIPRVEYDISKNVIVVMNVLQYSVIKTLSILPVVILISTLGFAFSTITSNSAVSVAMPILGYMGSNIINLFMERLKILKYFVTANWDLSVYLFGGKGLAEGLTLPISLVICLIYFVIMIVTTFIVFNKRDIKNV